ncbi:hypothetical protein AAVH_22152 [Aphelenchoides avenae]|nr:hypothetical protein AAVH_22152 [Aphelenchus avenae]
MLLNGTAQRCLGIAIPNSDYFSFQNKKAGFGIPTIVGTPEPRWAEPRLQIHLVVVTLSLAYTYGIVLWTEMQVFKKLRELGPSLHPVTRKMHSDVHKALVALAVGPFFSPMLPTLYFVFVLLFRLDFDTLPAFVTILASMITLINPITTCYFVRPFRRAVAKHLCFDDKPASSDMSYVSSTI